MNNSKRIGYINGVPRSVLCISLAFLLLILLACGGNAATSTPQTGGTSSADGVSNQLKVLNVEASVDPLGFSGACPVLFAFSGTILTDGSPGEVTYFWDRSDGDSDSERTISFKAGETSKKVGATWQLGGPGKRYPQFWQQLRVLSPEEMSSQPARFDLECAQAGASTPTPAPPGLLVSYSFDGNNDDTSGNNLNFITTNTEFEEGVLRLNGVFEVSDGGSVALTPIIPLDYSEFSISMDFKVDPDRETGEYFMPIVVGGTSYRWFSVYLTPKSELGVLLNDGDITSDSNRRIDLDRWYKLTAVFSLKLREVKIFLDNELVIEVSLRSDFNLEVIEQGIHHDKNITLTNQGQGTVFDGWVDNLEIHNGRIEVP